MESHHRRKRTESMYIIACVKGYCTCGLWMCAAENYALWERSKFQ